MGGNLKTTAEMKETMADALIRLLAEKPIGKITVPEIVDLAGVGRMSYFRNFSSKEEMITYKLIRLWNRWADENQLSERSSYTLENAHDFFAFNWSIRPLLCLIYRHNLQSAMYEAFYQIMAPKKSNAAKAYRSRFYSYGLFGLLDEWIKRDFQETPEEMVDIIYKISRPYTNFQMLVKKIKELVPNPEQILVTGFSAGAFATSLLTDAVAAAFPKCRDITACVDSAMMHYDWQRVAREVWKAPEEITARLTGNEIVSDSLLALHRNHPEIKIMYCCSVRDAALTQMEMYLEDGRWIPDKAAGVSFQRKLKEMLELLQNEIPDLSTFLFDTPDKNSKDADLTVHCLCGSNAAFTTVVNGVSCADWMMRGVSGEVLKLGLGLL